MLTLLVFSPALTAPYGTTDDYDFFRKVFLDGTPCWRLVLTEGRVLLGLLYDAVALLVDRFEDARAFRYAFVLGLLASVLSLFLLAVPRVGVMGGVVVAGLFAVSPPMLDIGALHPSFPVPIAATMALLAFAALQARTGAARSRLQGVLPVVSAMLLLVLSAAIYQSATLVFFVGVALELVSRPSASSRELIRELLRKLVVFITSMLIYATLLYSLLPLWFGANPSPRGTFAMNPLVKGVWFVALPLRDALIGAHFGSIDMQIEHLPALKRNSAISTVLVNTVTTPEGLVALAVLLLLIVGLWLRSQGEVRRRILFVSLALFLLPLSYSISLVIPEMWPSHRTQLALHGVVAVLLVVALREVLSQRLSAALVRTALALVLVAAAVSSASNQRTYISRPLSCEWRALRAAAEETRDATALVVVPTSALDSAAPGIRYDLGWPASAKPWGPRSMVRVARHSLGLPDVPVEVTPPGARVTEVPSGAAVIRLGCPAP